MSSLMDPQMSSLMGSSNKVIYWSSSKLLDVEVRVVLVQLRDYVYITDLDTVQLI